MFPKRWGRGPFSVCTFSSMLVTFQKKDSRSSSGWKCSNASSRRASWDSVSDGWLEGIKLFFRDCSALSKKLRLSDSPSIPFSASVFYPQPSAVKISKLGPSLLQMSWRRKEGWNEPKKSALMQKDVFSWQNLLMGLYCVLVFRQALVGRMKNGQSSDTG